MSITAVVGAQYGSEGKGVVVAHMADNFQHHVRTGGPNAGHSFVHRGKLWKMQGLPCGWKNPKADLYIGPGAVASFEVLKREVEAVYQVDPSVVSRLYIDRGATVLTEAHHHAEGGTGGDLHRDIGSTGEGVGEARIARIRRKPDGAPRWADLADRTIAGARVADMLADVSDRLNSANMWGDRILLEGTQGFGLSLVHGPWPNVTSADTTAAQLAADAGVPANNMSVVVVARTMPIRVAGNSGPLDGEMTWAELSTRIGKPVEERTTVTNKVRRIGTWDMDLFVRACRVNGATSAVLTFLDYPFPQDAGKTTFPELSAEAVAFVRKCEDAARVPVRLAGTGFDAHDGWSCVEVTR